MDVLVGADLGLPRTSVGPVYVPMELPTVGSGLFKVNWGHQLVSYSRDHKWMPLFDFEKYCLPQGPD